MFLRTTFLNVSVKLCWGFKWMKMGAETRTASQETTTVKMAFYKKF